MKRVWLAALGTCIVGYTAAIAAIVVERPYDAPSYVGSLSLWYQRDKPTILIVNSTDRTKAEIAPIVFRDEDSCERFRLTAPVDVQMRHAFCMPRRFIWDDSPDLDAKHLAVTAAGVWFYQQR